MAAVMTSIECGLFHHLDLLKPQDCTAKQLALHAGVEQALLERLLRLLASVHIVNEIYPNLYSPTIFSSALRREVFESGFRHNHATIQPVLSRLPFYLQEHGFTSPEDFTRGLWEWYKENPKYASYFNSWMSGTHTPEKETWLDAFPISALLAPVDNENGPSLPLIVDVGGGQGKDMELLRQHLLPEEFEIIVQDQQAVVDQTSWSDLMGSETRDC
ncbi:hypothetical protein PRZ48_011269 [Zasmidium cellare]|uniref:O-methyltransferase dimerisation domain-containing protein n=1 Tax=Zasmidium cellare TaxID=395010 RepID=A0ABR0EBF3_ZASCE|nr:hypothetical protein PRZ48_011269 [Zasmidium cellare]